MRLPTRIAFGCLSGVVVILVVALGSIFAFGGQIGNYCTQLAIQAARQNGVNIHVESSAFYPFTLSAKGIDAWVTKALLQLQANNIDVTVNPLSIVTMQPAIKVSSELYSGRIDSDITIVKDQTSGSLHISNLKFADHPQLNGLGFRSGTLSLDLPSFQFQQNGSYNTNGTIKILDASIPVLPKIPSFPLTFPGIEHLSTQAQIALTSDGTGTITLTEFNSNYGEIRNGAIRLRMNRAKLTGIDGEASVNLSQLGQKALGGYIALATNQGVKEDQTKIDVKWTSEPCGRNARVLSSIQISGLCVVFSIIPRQ